MDHTTEPPLAVRVLTVIAAGFVILLSGVTLGLYTNADSSIADSVAAPRSESREAAASREEGLVRPVLTMNHDTRNRARNHRYVAAPCQADTPSGGQTDHAPEPCSSMSEIDKQKLLVLIALWRLQS